MRALSRKRYARAQKGDLSRNLLYSFGGNGIYVARRSLLSTKSHMIAENASPAAEIDMSPQTPKYLKNFENMMEIVLGTNIGFVTIALHTQYKKNRNGNEHRCKVLRM